MSLFPGRMTIANRNLRLQYGFRRIDGITLHHEVVENSESDIKTQSPAC
jgi:hypothetical protein